MGAPGGLSMVTLAQARQNSLLAALDVADAERWLRQLEAVELPLGAVLHEPRAPIEYVYFPATAIISMLCVLENGASAEIAVVGMEGIVGISAVMSGLASVDRAVVQRAGQGFRLRARVLQDEFGRIESVRRPMLRFTQALLAQTSQTAVCNRHHTLDQQLCRWILMSLDRLSGDELAVTQELIANMLGVRREGVTEAAIRLQAAGLIRYSRGRISVLNRPGLEQRACGCYAVVRSEYSRLLPVRSAH